MPYGLGASFPTATATTPSHFSARLVSIRLMRACGKGECSILPTSMPGTLRSSVYLPAPVVFSAASIIAVGLPIMEKSLLILSFRAKPKICACLRRPLTWPQSNLCALHQSPTEWPRTSGCIQYNDTDCCLAPLEHRPSTDLDFRPTATSRS